MNLIQTLRNLWNKPANFSAVRGAFAMVQDYLPTSFYDDQGRVQLATRPRVTLNDPTATYLSGNERLVLQAHLRALEMDLERLARDYDTKVYVDALNAYYKGKVHVLTGLCAKEFFNLLPTERRTRFMHLPEAARVIAILERGEQQRTTGFGGHVNMYINNNHTALMRQLYKTFFPGRKPNWDKISVLEDNGVQVFSHHQTPGAQLTFRNHHFSV